MKSISMLLSFLLLVAAHLLALQLKKSGTLPAKGERMNSSKEQALEKTNANARLASVPVPTLIEI